MKKVIDCRILFLGVLFFASSCAVDSLGSKEYLEGVNGGLLGNLNTTNIITNTSTNTSTNVSTSVVTNIVTNILTNTISTTNIVTNNVTNSVTNILTNSVTNILTNSVTNILTNSVTNVLTNTVTNVLTNVLTNTVTNTITNTITNQPEDFRTAKQKFLDAMRAKEMVISDNVGVKSYGDVSTFGNEIYTNVRTSTSANKDTTAAKILFTGVSTYVFEDVTDADGFKGTYFGQVTANQALTSTRTTAKLTITLNSLRTGGTIVSDITVYLFNSSGTLVSGYPQSVSHSANFVLPLK